MAEAESKVPQMGSPEWTQYVIDEAARRTSTYYDVHPGEPDCPVEPLTLKRLVPAGLLFLLLVVAWIVGEYVILPMYY